MRRLIQSSTLLLIWCFSLVGLQQARASHAQAGQITYRYISTAANGDQTYRVQAQFFRDCSGIAAPTSFTLNAVQTCGGAARTVNLPQVGQPVIGSPYCASIQSLVRCNLNGITPPLSPIDYPNYVTVFYENNIVLPPAAEWILSIEENARPTLANLDAGTLRLEARLNSLITPVGGTPIVITNNSATFSSTNLPVILVYELQESVVSFTATDIDRTNGRADSLVYSLDQPLQGCGQFETYKTRSGTNTCNARIDPNCNYRFITCAPGSTGGTYGTGQPNAQGQYTNGIPLSVTSGIVYENGSTTPPPCPTSGPIVTAVEGGRPNFDFNATAASFRFTPTAYRPGASNLGLNKFAVVGKVTEYRKINGTYYKVGSVRRDFLIIVQQGSGNTVPAAPGGAAGPPKSGVTINVTRDTTDVRVFTCNYSRVRLTFTDPDNTPGLPAAQQQRLKVFYPADINTNLLQGGDIGQFVLSNDSTATPTVTFYFQPTRAAGGTTILIPLRVEDNGCPVKGVQFRTVRIIIQTRPNAAKAIINNNQGLGGTNIATVCAGGAIRLDGSVDRPDSIRIQATGQVRAQQYAYRWVTVNGSNNGLPTTRNVASITVRPTVTTRYRLYIDPTEGFSPGTCGDTTSILVRVVNAPQLRVTASDTVVCPGSSVSLTSIASRNDNLTDTYTYRVTGKGLPTAGLVGSQVNVTPTENTTYTVVAQGDTAYRCSITRQISIRVAPIAKADFEEVDSTSARPGSTTLIVPATFRFRNLSSLTPNNANFALDSVRWTYQRIKDAQGRAVTGEPVVRFSSSRNIATNVFTVPGTYAVTLTVGTRASGQNCPPSSRTRNIFVPDIKTPNIITPNSDGKNDFFEVSSTQQGGKLLIFNRWGRQLEEINNYRNTWDGGNHPDGIYYYQLIDTRGESTKGWIEVVRGNR